MKQDSTGFIEPPCRCLLVSSRLLVTLRTLRLYWWKFTYDEASFHCCCLFKNHVLSGFKQTWKSLLKTTDSLQKRISWNQEVDAFYSIILFRIRFSFKTEVELTSPINLDFRLIWLISNWFVQFLDFSTNWVSFHENSEVESNLI